ncbi:unnamed protein product [Urochloa humidicola]
MHDVLKQSKGNALNELHELWSCSSSLFLEVRTPYCFSVIGTCDLYKVVAWRGILLPISRLVDGLESRLILLYQLSVQMPKGDNVLPL